MHVEAVPARPFNALLCITLVWYCLKLTHCMLRQVVDAAHPVGWPGAFGAKQQVCSSGDVCCATPLLLCLECCIKCTADAVHLACLMANQGLVGGLVVSIERFLTLCRKLSCCGPSSVGQLERPRFDYTTLEGQPAALQLLTMLNCRGRTKVACVNGGTRF